MAPFMILIVAAFLAGLSAAVHSEATLRLGSRAATVGRPRPLGGLLQKHHRASGEEEPQEAENLEVRRQAVFLQKPKARRSPGDEEDDGSSKVDYLGWPLWVRVVLFGSTGLALTVCLVHTFFVFCTLWCHYRSVMDQHERAHDGEQQTATFVGYLKFRFGYWFVWTRGSNFIVICALVVMSLFAGGVLYCLMVGKRGLFIATGLVACSLGEYLGALWKTFVWLVAPDAGVSETSFMGRIVGAFISIVGLVLFALLLAMMQEAFTKYLSFIRNNSIPCMETGHIVLVGITDNTMPIIHEFCKAYEVSGGTTIVILSQTLSKPDMEQKIKDLDIELLGSRIVVRAGTSTCQADLRMVSAESARSIVVMADRDQPKETRDAFVMRALISLRGKGWPTNGRILAVCSLVRNKVLLEHTGGPKTDVLMLDSFVGKLMVQCSKHQGLGTIVKETTGFDGSDFYITPTPKLLLGKTVADAALHYPSAVICGIMRSGDGAGCKLCPGNDYTLKAGEELVLLATDSACIVAKKTPTTSPQLGHLSHTNGSPRLTPRQQSQGKPEKILIMGRNEKTGYIVLELDEVVPAGTKVILVSPQPLGELQNDITVDLSFKKELQNITIKQVQGELGSRYMLEELPDNIVAEASRIFILGDDNASDPRDADTCTLGVLMQLRDMLLDTKESLGASTSTAEFPRSKIPVIPEIQDPESTKHCRLIQTCDFVDTSVLPSQVLAMVAYNPRIGLVLEEILSESSTVKFAIRTLQDYIQPGTEPPSSINFVQVQYLAGEAGDVLIGWSRGGSSVEEEDVEYTRSAGLGKHRPFKHVMREQASCSGVGVEWEINPEDKIAEREWSGSLDMLVVLCPHSP